MLLFALAPHRRSDSHAQALASFQGSRRSPGRLLADLAVAAGRPGGAGHLLQPAPGAPICARVDRFFLAHEYGHLHFRHTRMGLSDLPDATRDSVLRLQELEADCYAARQEGAEARLDNRGGLRSSPGSGHSASTTSTPRGPAREPGPDVPARPRARSRGEGRQGWKRGRSVANRNGFASAVTVPTPTRAGYGGDAEVWSRGGGLGTLSNLRAPTQLSVDHLGAGLVNYRGVDLGVPARRANCSSCPAEP